MQERAGATAATVKVTIGRAELPDSEVFYAGVSPGLAGVYQVNLRSPTDGPDGNLPVSLHVGNYRTPPAVYVTVQR